ncbi:hypothetical protein GOODEAATRI_026196 [Goodea atripinnis]|uniref:Uncharacterized protein n=1 Tax=Goodea atripinnis TaxID=208336 RepID=A0ABV0PHC0_9TELE
MVHSVTARCGGPVAAEQALIILPPPCLIVEVFLLIYCVCLLPNMVVIIVVKHLYPGLIRPKSCPSSRCSFASLSPAAILLLERRGFLLQPFQSATLVQCLSSCPVLTFSL